MHDGPAGGWPEFDGQEPGPDEREPADAAANGQVTDGSVSPARQDALWAAQHDPADNDPAEEAWADDDRAGDDRAPDEDRTRGEGLAPGEGLADDDPASSLGLRACLEAILLVADEPVAENLLAQIVERPTSEVAATLHELSADYTAERRGFDLREVAGGWRFYTRAECAGIVERFVSDGQEVRLTQASLETLAVVAYRQPVSRARVSAVRGVNCDGVMRTLVLRGLVEEGGTDAETGAILFQTTSYFLERLGLARLSELPDLAPFLPDQLDDELDPGNEFGR
jgi:segregation and condensation protein B